MAVDESSTRSQYEDSRNNSAFPSQSVAGRERPDSFDQGERVIGRAESQVVDESGRVDARRHEAGPEQCANFRGKEKIRTGLSIVERLDAHGIAGDEQAVPARVPEGKGKHAAELRQALLAPTCIGFQHNFGVGVADETCAGLFEFVADVAEVVDLAVVDDPVAGLGIMHGLVGQRGEIENRQAPVAQADFNWVRNGIAQKDRARIIGPAMRERLRATFENAVRDSRVARNDAKDSAHSESHLQKFTRLSSLSENRAYLNRVNHASDTIRIEIALLHLLDRDPQRVTARSRRTACVRGRIGNRRVACRPKRKYYPRQNLKCRPKTGCSRRKFPLRQGARGSSWDWFRPSIRSSAAAAAFPGDEQAAVESR